MAISLVYIYFLFGISICYSFSNVWSPTKQENDIIDELVQRLGRIEVVQAAQQKELVKQKRVIEEQAREITLLKEERSKIQSKLAADRVQDTGAANEDEFVVRKDTNVSMAVQDMDGVSPLKTIVEVKTTPRRSDIYSRSKRQEGGVAFTVYLDHDANLGLHQTVKFNKVLTNEGGAYNIHTGVFTCPTSGMYMFAFYIGERDETTGPEGVGVSLMVNSELMVDGVVDTFHVSQDLQAGNIAVKRLTQGDAVWVEIHGGSHVEGSPNFRLSTFTGVLLYA